MRANVILAGEIINTIEIEESCVPLSATEYAALTEHEQMSGNFFIIADGVSVELIQPEQA